MGAADYADFRWVGNEKGYAGQTHYASIELQDIVDEIRSVLNAGQIGAGAYRPSEVDVSIRPGWFYHPDQDKKVKTASKINKIWFDSIGRNAMMLLSFPPDTRGLVCDVDAEKAIASGKCIEKMLSLNYADDAKISVSGDSIIKVTDRADGEQTDVFCGNVLDIVMPEPKRINVFSIGELIEAGERIVSFKLESIEEDSARLLYSGTSVGFRRAFVFEEGEYIHLRFSVTESVADPLLARVGLYFFEDADDVDQSDPDGELVKTIELSRDGCRADVFFGGIYPFDRIEFSLDRRSEYKVYAFSGQVYEPICEGEAIGRVGINLPVPISESYQIRIDAATTRLTDISVKLRAK
jgi:hypothetical protein